MLEERELQTKILMVTKTLEYIEELGFNLEKEKSKLDKILNGTFSENGKIYKFSSLKKTIELEKLLKDLKRFDEYFKLLNELEFIKRALTQEKLSDKYIFNIIEFIKRLRTCRVILDDTQKEKLHEIYITLYNIILVEILNSEDFDSKILRQMTEDKFDEYMLNEIILEEIKRLEDYSYLEISSYNLLRDNILFLKSQGVKNFARLEIMSKLLACIHPEKVRERLNGDLSALYESISTNNQNINMKLNLLDTILEKYNYIKSNISKEKMNKTLLSFLLTFSISLGIGGMGAKVASDLSKQKLYKTETTIYNSFTDSVTTTESWQTELERTFTRNRVDYSTPYWSKTRKSYVLNIETFDFTDRYRGESYEECLNKSYISSLSINDEYKEISEEEALTILENISTDYLVWAKEIVDTTQDKSEYIEEIDRNKLIKLLLGLYVFLGGVLYGLDKKYKAGLLYSQIKGMIEVIKTSKLTKKDYKFLSLEYEKVFKEYEDYIKNNQELNEIYQNTKREMLNTLGESYKDEQALVDLIEKLESKLDEIKPEDINYTRKLGR